MSRHICTNLRASLLQRKGKVDINNPEQYRHIPLAPKTSDPEALNFDKAVEIVLTGLRHARHGDLQTACLQIATAFLLDVRSVKFVFEMPPSVSADVELPCVDPALSRRLIEADRTGFGCAIIHIILGQYLGDLPGDGQKIVAHALKSIDCLIAVLEKEPWIEKTESGILGGYLTRAKLFELRASFQMTMGNMKRASKDLSSALKCDPSYTSAREARANLWASQDLKNSGDVHREFLRVVKERHPDSTGMVSSYAWLGITLFRDPNLGTLAEAKEYYKKSIQASIRQREIYGDENYHDLPSFSLLKSIFINMRKHPSDTFFIPEAGNEDKKHLCLACGKREQGDGSKLMKCGRCKSVSYCSRMCQMKDWKAHKSYCKIAATKPEEHENDVD
ncbi:hypothetical protein CTEN210_04383 [Chaetoceros tenuissimus]|uniref:MYND-type domain-containing protein n=1 Tax=Chaetoceros tenuissimus TaxID=426638 RepID=A0AAD3CKT2_9STRA|nr:hypothetical protein CTEN210_04383 [Chaetoceros tenuissimus]